MKIACLGWGSLVWDPRNLPIRPEWFKDGPFAPVEFRRKSSDGRITLVIDRSAARVQLLWALMLPTDLPTARTALCDRECIPHSHCGRDIDSWQTGESAPDVIQSLPAWAQAHEVDAVIWTALLPKFDQVRSPSVRQIKNYLQGLTGCKRDKAEQYVRCAPRQIKTEYRRQIEAEIGWSYRKRWP
ncbi:MAG: hypothetical protein ACREQB_08900 [Candidatus Binataceae bacterium]